MLLMDMQRLFEERHTEWLSSTEVAEALAEMEDRPWPEFGKSGKPISARQIAQKLKPFDIRPWPSRIDGYKAGTRGYELEKLEDAFNRYLPPSQSATGLNVVALTAPRKATSDAGCCSVAFRNPENLDLETEVPD